MRQVLFRKAAHNFRRRAYEIETSGEPVTILVHGEPAIIIEPASLPSASEKRAIAKRHRYDPRKEAGAL